MNLPTVIICIVLAAVLGLVIYKMIKDKRQGKSSCGGSCGSCPMGGCCHSAVQKGKK